MPALIPPSPPQPLGPEALLHVLLDASATGVAQLCPVQADGDFGELVDFRYVRLNPAAQRLLALPEHPAQTLCAQGAPSAGLFAFYRDVFLAGTPGHFDFSGVAAAGHPYAMRIAAQRSGPHLLASFTEIPAEQLFRQLFDQTPAAICVVRGPAYLFEYVNPAFRRLFPGRQLIGRTVAEAMPEVLPQGMAAPLDQVYQSGGSYAGVEIPLAIAQPGGHPPKHHFFNFIYQAHPEAGQPTWLSVFANDVTEKVLARQQREAWRVEWQHFFEQAPVAIAVLRGPQHIVELVNPASCALWGRTPQQVLGRPLLEALPEAASQYSQPHLAEALATGVPYLAHEQLTTLHRLGHTDKLYLNFVYQPLRDSNNQITGLAVMATDVSEHVQSRQRVQLLNDELRQVNDELLAANEELHANNHELAQAKQKLQELNQELECRVAAGVLEAQQARDAAEQQRRQLARFFQQAPVAICVLDGPKLVFELVNPEYQRQFPGRELLGRPLQEALPELVKQPMHEWLRNVYRTGVTHEGQEVPLAIPPAEGWPPEQHYFDCVYQARLDEQGNIDGVLVFAHDVTERVLAQQHIKALQTEAQTAAERLAQERETFYQIFEHTPALVTLMRGPEHRFAYTNRSFERLFPGRQVHNQPLAEALPEIAALGFVSILDRVYKTGESYVANEQPLTIRQPDGSVLQEMYLNLTYQPYHDNGQTLGVSVFAYDVTEQVLARQQVDQALTDLRISNTQLTRTNADLDTFIYTASHDLKSPIANIEGLLLLLRKQLPAAARQAGMVPRVLDMMQGAIERFQLTIAQLTDLAKLQHAHTQPVEEVDLPAVVEAVRLDLTPLLAEAHAELLVNLDSCTTVSFAPQHLRSIVYNLLSNAIKYRHPHRPLVVQIRCHRATSATTLEVQDNGLGLTPEQQSKLFSMFRRLHDHVPGSGVGLHMVKRIIENAGGTIAVSSQVGVGSIFTVSLSS